MQDAGDDNVVALLPIEHDMLSVLVPAQTWQNVLAGSAQRWSVRQHLTTRLKVVDVGYGLSFAPIAQRIGRYAE